MHVFSSAVAHTWGLIAMLRIPPSCPSGLSEKRLATFFACTEKQEVKQLAIPNGFIYYLQILYTNGHIGGGGLP
jgi:hypothetical protein